ncbi:hypothetical protein lerEdw1_004354, partial [Lerista edwardsae]
ALLVSGPVPSPLLKAMSLIIRNLQSAVPLRRTPLRKKVEQLRCLLGVQGFDLGVICVSNKRIQQLNRRYKQRDAPTDVLSFPFHENLKAGELPQSCAQDEYNLGDIFLGVEYIFQQCENKEEYNSILTVSKCLLIHQLSQCLIFKKALK